MQLARSFHKGIKSQDSKLGSIFQETLQSQDFTPQIETTRSSQWPIRVLRSYFFSRGYNQKNAAREPLCHDDEKLNISISMVSFSGSVRR
jgi:hypothetical protein